MMENIALMQPIKLKLKLKLKGIQTKKLKNSLERVYHYAEDEKRFSRIRKKLIFGKKIIIIKVFPPILSKLE